MPLTQLETDVLAQTKSERYALTANQRQILRFFMGYSRAEDNSRAKIKSKSRACRFIRKTIFENDNDDDDDNDNDDDEVFRFRGPDKSIDLKNYALFPSVTNTDEDSVKQFLSQGGIGLTDQQEMGIVRALTSFNSIYQTDLYLNRGEKCLTG